MVIVLVHVAAVLSTLSRIAWLSGAVSFLFGLTGPEAIAALYVLIAQPRMSRWPLFVVVMVAFVRAGLSGLVLGGAEGADPVAALFSLWPIGLFLLLVLPHWRKMNWRLLGKLPDPRPDIAQHFS